MHVFLSFIHKRHSCTVTPTECCLVYVTYRYKVRCKNQSHQWIYHLEWNKQHFSFAKEITKQTCFHIQFMIKHPLFRVPLLPLGKSRADAACSRWQFPGRLAVVNLPIGWKCWEERDETRRLDHCWEALSDWSHVPCRVEHSAYFIWVLFYCCGWDKMMIMSLFNTITILLNLTIFFLFWPLATLEEIYHACRLRRAIQSKIIRDPSHPGHHLLERLL